MIGSEKDLDPDQWKQETLDDAFLWDASWKSGERSNLMIQ